MARPNFFCSVDAINCLLGKKITGEYRDIELTVDLIEAPLLLIYSVDGENRTMRVILRGETYSHDGSGTELGSVVENKASGQIMINGMGALSDSAGAFFSACRRLGCYLQENGLEDAAEDFDPESEGIMLCVGGGELRHRYVSGKARPDMMCRTLSGNIKKCRPYSDEFIPSFDFGDVPFEVMLAAAEDGDESFYQDIAVAYLDGDELEDVEPDPEKALYWFIKSAEAGDTASAFNVGLFYAKGFGTERSFEKAAEWMDRAAEDGDEDAEVLADKYRQAIADLALAEKGDAQAQGRLAGFFMAFAESLQQSGTDSYYEESLKWAALAADKGNGDGLWTLALAYEHGRGVEQDRKTAFEYYKKGAALGHERSLNSLGSCYAQGDVVEQNIRMAFELFLRAALLGDGEAMSNLGRCYQFGNGCFGSMKKAMAWYRRSLELIQDEELEQRVAMFEMMPDMDDDEDYCGEDSELELTDSEQAFLDRIDAALPEDVKDAVKDPDSVF